VSFIGFSFPQSSTENQLFQGWFPWSQHIEGGGTSVDPNLDPIPHDDPASTAAGLAGNGPLSMTGAAGEEAVVYRIASRVGVSDIPPVELTGASGTGLDEVTHDSGHSVSSSHGPGSG
jgi:hypothetical protein